MSFRRVELNVFSLSRVEFLSSRMSFHRVSNACSLSPSAYSLSCNNYSLRDVTFALLEPSSTHANLRSISYLFAWTTHILLFSCHFDCLDQSKYFHGLQTLILLPIVGAYLVFLKYISKAGSAVGAVGEADQFANFIRRSTVRLSSNRGPNGLKTQIIWY